MGCLGGRARCSECANDLIERVGREGGWVERVG